MRMRLPPIVVGLALLGPAMHPAEADLLVSDASAPQILRVDTGTGDVVGRIDTPSAHYMSSEPNGDLLVGRNERVDQINPSTGDTIRSYLGADLSTSNDLTYGPDGDLYVAGGGGSNAVVQFDGATGAVVRRYGGLSHPPTGVAIGSDGDLYVSSATTNSVERIDATTGAVVDTISNVGLDQPRGLAFGPGGDVYVANSGGNSVTRLDPTTDSVVGTISGGLSRPSDVAVGPGGNLFVTSAFTHDVVRFNTATGDQIGTYSGGGLLAPYGVTFDANGNLLASGDGASSGAVVRFDTATGAVLSSVDSGLPPSASGVAVAPDGSVLVGSFQTSPTNEVYRLDGGTLQPSGGLSLVGVGASGGAVRGPGGDVYVASNGTNFQGVIRFNGDTGAIVDTISAQQPGDMVLGPGGTLFISSSGTDSVIRLDPSTGAVLQTYSGGGLVGPRGLALGAHGDLFAVGIGTSKVVRFDEATGDVLGTYTGDLPSPDDVALGPDGGLYVTDDIKREVVRFDVASGRIDGVIKAPGLQDSQGVQVAPDGSVLAVSGLTHQVLRLDPSSGKILSSISTGNRGIPGGMVVGSNGDLFVMLRDRPEILEFDPQTGAQVGQIDLPATTTAAADLRFGLDGDLYVATNDSDQGTLPDLVKAGRVLRIDPLSGSILDVFTSGYFSDAGPGSANGLAFGPDGTLYVTGNSQVFRLDTTTGQYIPIVSGLDEAKGVVVGPDGDLYVAEAGNGVVARIDPATGAVLNTFSDGLRTPAYLSFGPDGDLYVGDGSSSVFRFDPVTGALLGTISPPQFFSPFGLLFTSTAVPEPPSAVLAALAAALGLVLGRRRRRPDG